MPNKHTTDGNYRYAFQGQEKDAETEMEAFELRLWDGRLGRWLTVDPAGEFYSPYLGIGNNPVSFIDPDGGDIIFYGLHPDTNKYYPIIIIKSDIYNINYYTCLTPLLGGASRAPLELPLLNTYYGFDTATWILGRPDAIRFNYSIGVHAGVLDVGGTISVVAPLQGKDKGGLFYYRPGKDSGADIGFEKDSRSLQIDASHTVSFIYDSDRNYDNFRRNTFEGVEKMISGGYKLLTANLFQSADKSYYGFSLGLGGSLNVFSGDKNRTNSSINLSGATLFFAIEPGSGCGNKTK